MEVTRAIRQIEQVRGGRLPAIAMGARATPAEQAACDYAGTSAYLAKPLRARALFDLIERVVAPARTAEEHRPCASVFDRARFLARIEGDEGLGREIVDMFLQEYPKLMENIHRAAEQGNPNLLERAAHSLKGSVGDMAAPEAMEAARVLERFANEGKLDQAAGVLKTLDESVDRLALELRNSGGQ
jgi:HPt (histidine-containing phosphotransfer) domain-containing protein